MMISVWLLAVCCYNSLKSINSSWCLEFSTVSEGADSLGAFSFVPTVLVDM